MRGNISGTLWFVFIWQSYALGRSFEKRLEGRPPVRTFDSQSVNFERIFTGDCVALQERFRVTLMANKRNDRVTMFILHLLLTVFKF